MTVNLDRAKAIRGWMARRELRWLAEQARQCTTLIEIGCSRGRSTRALGDHVQGTVYSIDPWNDVPEYHVGYGDWAYATAQQNLHDLIATGRVILLRGSSSDMAPLLATRLAGPVDLVFIDGDHSYDGVSADIAAYRPLLRAGGILSGHDYNSVPRHAGVRQAVDERVTGVQHVGSIWWATV